MLNLLWAMKKAVKVKKKYYFCPLNHRTPRAPVGKGILLVCNR